MKILKLSIIPAVILGSTIATYGTVIGVNAEPTQKQPKNPYPQEVTDAYLEACFQQSVAQGFTQEQSEVLCNCTLEQFQTRYTFDEFLQVYGAEDQNQEEDTSATILDIGSTCAAKLTQEMIK